MKHTGFFKKWFLLYILLDALVAGPGILSAADLREASLTTAFLYNFAKYTEWPDAAFENGQALTICLEPDSSIEPLINKLEKRTIKERTIRVKHLFNADLVESCHLAYFEKQSEAYTRLQNEHFPVLIVGRDIPSSDISLYKVDDTLQFKIRLKRVRKLGLIFRSQLLQIAAATIE